MKSDLLGENPLLLVVDDDPNMRLLTRAALEPVGFRVAEAEDGAGLMKIMLQRRRRFHSIFLPGSCPMKGSFS
jgi:CheY-like chemotaxis protein